MAPSPEPGHWTVRRLLAWCAAFFADKGIDSPRLTADLLLAHCLGVPRIQLYTDPDLPLSPEERDLFKSLIRRRAAREPVAYITGAREFYGLTYRVNPDVLIPRPDTEHLVAAVLAVLPAVDPAAPLRVLDLGTGSGAIAVTLAHERPGHCYVATDRSPAALRVAAENARTHGVADAVVFCCGNWTAPLAGPAFHIIVSNPPYIGDDEWADLAPEVSDFEPRHALGAGPDGLDAYRAILADAPRCLFPGGQLFLEIGHRQRRAVSALAEARGFGAIRCLRDYAGHDRVLHLAAPVHPAGGGEKTIDHH